MGYEPPKTSAQRVAKRRAALRAQGLRPKTIWVPDTRTSQFQEQVRKANEQIRAQASRYEDVLAFAEALAADAIAALPAPLDDEG
jgi:DNA-binding LacI/PurR family transcriptional regulator